ncbi:MAG: hypothetical protein LC797_07335 [Chloroflexi bacterium]|nr:hypothetical protein [Chloroflexota bacterium]
MQQPLAARRQAQPTGVIETLSAGYAAVNHHLWVLVLPILLDVFLWLGPHVSYSPLVDPVVTRATEWTRQVALGPRRAPNTPDLLTAANLDQTRQWAIDRADEVNGLALLAWGPVALPSPAALPSPNPDLAFVSGWVDGALLGLACIGVSLLLGGWFYGGLAEASRGARGGPLAAGRSTPRAVAGVLGLVGLVLGTAVLLGLPVLLLIGFTALVSPPVAVLGTILVAAGWVFASVHLFFAIDAIFVSKAGPLGAIQRSVSVVRRHLRPSVAFIVLTWLILAGMARIWEVLASNVQSPFGVALGILGNAYIASGLIAAGMIFYTQHTESTPAPAAATPF